MPPITIDLPTSIRQRLLAEVPPLDRDSFVATALMEALDKRAKMVHTKKMSPDIEIQSALPVPSATRRGRPPKGAIVDRRVYRSVGLAQRTWDKLEQVAKHSGLSVNDAIEALALAAPNVLPK